MTFIWHWDIQQPFFNNYILMHLLGRTVFENGQRVSFSNFGIILCFGRNLWFFLPVGVACVLRTSWSFFYKFFYRAANSSSSATRVAGHKLRHYAEVVVPSHLHQPLFRESIWPLFFLGATTAVARTFVGIYCPHYFHSKTVIQNMLHTPQCIKVAKWSQ